jgi:ectoine hydroxylase-related dioxygenase (phytanoyl-CoA dioxygenase family)
MCLPALRDTQLVRNAKAIGSALLGIPVDQLTHWGHFIEKHGDGGHETPWHQDEAYWEPGFTYEAVASWVPLRDVDVDDGCLWFLPGVHTGGVWDHTHAAGDPSVQLLVVTEEVDLDRAVPVPLPAGGCSFHHPRMLHHARPNTSGRTRRAVANEVQAVPVARDVPADHPWHAADKAGAEAYFATTLIG